MILSLECSSIDMNFLCKFNAINRFRPLPKGFNPGKKWKNFSWLEGNKYHCHLTYRYVACWEVLDEKIQLMEVYYVGSREKSPY